MTDTRMQSDRQPDVPRAEAMWQFGAGITVLAVALWYAPRASGPPDLREGTYFWILALLLGPFGSALLLSGLAEHFRLPGWRPLRWLPALAIGATYIGFKRLL